MKKLVLFSLPFLHFLSLILAENMDYFKETEEPKYTSGIIEDKHQILSNETEGKKPSTKLVYVTGGSFMMGSKQGDKDEKPIHKVHIKSFYISKYEVTSTQYAKFLNYYKSDRVKTGPYKGRKMIYEHEFGLLKIEGKWLPQPGFEKNPVVCVTWFGANEFCRILKCRLPSEAEWEFAARGGMNSGKFKYCGSNKPDDVAWYYKNSKKEPHPIAGKRPNELNIYDLSGNVWEWCSDIYDEEYYSHSSTFNPRGPVKGIYRVARGGSYISSLSNIRCTDRVRATPDDKSVTFGFRYVKSIMNKPAK